MGGASLNAKRRPVAVARGKGGGRTRSSGPTDEDSHRSAGWSRSTSARQWGFAFLHYAILHLHGKVPDPVLLFD